jgi:hypothetical protein
MNLKINAPKSNFCAIETEYLGYILTQDGIKPQPKKVQLILAILPPIIRPQQQTKNDGFHKNHKNLIFCDLRFCELYKKL